jgi:hypothetical protein
LINYLETGETGAGKTSVVSLGVFSAPLPISGAIIRSAPGRTLIQAFPFPRIIPSAATSNFGVVFTFIFFAL